MVFALILVVIVSPAAGLGFFAIRGVFSADDQTDQSWTAPLPSQTATIIDLNSIRRKRAA